MDLENTSTVLLVQEAYEAMLLKRYLRGMLKKYSGISHAELEGICAMFCIGEEGDDE